MNNEEFAEKMEQLEKAARTLGLYMEHSAVLVAEGDEEAPMLAARFAIGKVAFRPRTQDPEQARADQEFGKLVEEQSAHDFNATKERMRRNIEAGRDPLDDGEGEGASQSGN